MGTSAGLARRTLRCTVLLRPGLALVVAAHAAGTVAGDPASVAHLGALIFNGDVAVPAHLRGDPQPLPAAASRCVNCHAQDPGRSGFAPPLSRVSLTVAQPRRGGPASAYDASAFCRVLRTGIDPMQIVLARGMPQFDASDRDCSALWTFLTQRSGS